MSLIKAQLANTCLSFLFVMFVMCSFFFLLSFTNSLSNVSTVAHIEDPFDLDEDNEFAVQRYTWRCLDKKCVKTLAENDEVPLNTCKMLCAEPPVWPKPVHLQVTNKDASVINLEKISIRFSPTGVVGEMLTECTKLFIKNLKSLKSENQSSTDEVLMISLIIADSNVSKLKMHTNESYHLVVEKKDLVTATIFAPNFFGARHGLESLSQLIWYDEVFGALRILHDVEIIDTPKFPHRGVLIDTARNYFPLTLLKKVVDGMAMTKLNVLHLHLTDAVSFPIVLPKVKKLASFGAYGPDMIYTPEDVKDLVQYSLIRGVRVLLEVDAPGHVNAGWNFNKSQQYVICGEDDVLNGHLNPDNDGVLNVLENIYSDLLELSGNNEMFHMGSDEVNLTCWQNTEAVKKLRPSSMKEFWADYINKMLDRLKKANDGDFPEYVVLWSSPLTESPKLESLNKKVVVQHWLGNPSRILNNGYQVIFSTVGHWYLDCGFGRWRPSMNSGVCDPYTPWQTFYQHRPWDRHQEQVLGGEVCLWAEQVEVDTLETRIWPRAAAFAERVWSDPGFMDDYDVYTRLVSFVERLKSNGLKSAAMWPRWCSQNPGKC